MGSTRFLEIIFFSSLGFFSDFELRTRKYLRIILRYLTYAKKGGGSGERIRNRHAPTHLKFELCIKIHENNPQTFPPPPCQPLPPNNTSDTLSEKKRFWIRTCLYMYSPSLGAQVYEYGYCYVLIFNLIWCIDSYG